MNFLVLVLKTKKKNSAHVNRIVVITKRVVTYGIRVGSTRDLGITTDVLITVGVLGHWVCVLKRFNELRLPLL